MRKSKPTVKVNCVASQYEGFDERIIEYSPPDGSGGLIALTMTDEGPLVNLYRHDAAVQIMISKAEYSNYVSDKVSGLLD